MSMLSETPGASTSASTSNAHLSYYTPANPEKSESPPPQAAAPRELSKNRLYVGSLHPTVDEYTFLQVFAKFGKVSKLDFLFHKSGPSKGKPRGYAFVEYKEKEDALKALVNAHDKLLRGRKLVVTYANHAPTYDMPMGGPGKHHRRGEQSRPTTLSLIKATSHQGKTKDKIAILEAKLRQMEKQEPNKLSSLPSHPSLPLKPPPSSISTSSAPEPNRPPPRISSPHLPNTSNPRRPAARNTGPTISGIFASGTSNVLGKKPTLEELMRSKKPGTNDGFLKK